jgi:hypothetical protein
MILLAHARTVLRMATHRIVLHRSQCSGYRLYAHAVPQAQQQALDAMERILQG